MDKILDQGLKQLNLTLNEEQKKQLLDFVKILMKWNKVFNLTAIVEEDEVLTRHIFDSLSIVPYLAGQAILDVGSGAGLPGIPCAVTLPQQKFTLLDSNGKKTRFITQVIAELQLKNIEVVQARIEKYQPSSCFNHIIARAFSSVEKIAALTMDLLCHDGTLLLMKGIYPQAELQNMSNHVKVYPLSVPGLNEQRHLVCLKRSS